METYGYHDLETFLTKFFDEVKPSGETALFGAEWFVSEDSPSTCVEVIRREGRDLIYYYIDRPTGKRQGSTHKWNILDPMSIVSVRLSRGSTRARHPILTIIDTSQLPEEIEYGNLTDRTQGFST